MAINPERSLASLYPHVAAEWHPSKNGDVTPDTVAAQSNKKRWWLCAEGHEWEAVVQNRTVRSRGCKACSLLRGGSLASKFPLVAKQWHPSKNGDVTPDLIPPKSARKFYWLCPSDSSHEWFAGVDKRTSYGAGCQVCGAGQVDVSDAKKRPYRRHGLLMDEYPDLAKQWHPTKNERKLESISSGSAVDAFWKCESGHEWKARVSSRTLDGRGCPECAKLSRGSLAEANPTLASEWHPTLNGDLTPALVNISHKDKVWWLGEECGHAWRARIYVRANSTDKCPVCENRLLLTGVNDLATLNPTLAAEWHPILNGDISPSDVIVNSSEAYWWLCPDGHEWKTSLSSRSLHSCPVCANRKVLVGFNDLETTHPTLASEWHPTLNETLLPTQVTAGSGHRVWWKCIEGHEWVSTVNGRSNGGGCGTCANKRVMSGFNDLNTLNPTLASQWHPTKNGELTPRGVTSGSKKNVWWQCIEGHEWKACISDRSFGTGCPQCAARTFSSAGEKELKTIISLLCHGNISGSDRSVIKGELDIYVPEKRLAVEFNGLYWHSEAAGKDRNYHSKKSQECAEKGIHLIHVWEDDWRDRRDIVVRALAHRLSATERLNESGVLLLPDESLTRRYGARTLSAEVITYQESAAFLEANHIQGKANGTLHAGLRDKEGTLRAVFVAKRVGNKGHEGEWRIERYATRGIVPGGFTKLMKFAEQHIHHSNLGDLTQWVTFSDGALSDGGLYRNYGFEEDGYVRPDYMYVVNGKRVHKFNYRLKRFRDDPKLTYDADMSERELALLNNIPRIWDSGKTRWAKKVSS